MHRLFLRPRAPAADTFAMRYQITREPAYLKAELFERQTAEETRQFLDAVAAECIAQQCWRVLISVHESRPIFTVEKYQLSSFIEFARERADRIAVVADSGELRLAHEYATMLARLAGVNVRTFRSDAAAAEWLEADTGQPAQPDSKGEVSSDA